MMVKYALALFAFMLVIGISNAANITLSYSECRTVVLLDNSTDYICAPMNTSLNESAVYKAAFDTCVQRIDNISLHVDNSTSSIRQMADYIGQNLTAMNRTFAGIVDSVERLGGINVTGDYASCLVRLNQTQIDSAALQRRVDNLSLVMQGMVSMPEYNLLATQKQDALSLADSRKDDLRNGAIIGIVVGIVVFWYWKKRNPSSDLDISGGRAPKMGNR